MLDDLMTLAELWVRTEMRTAMAFDGNAIFAFLLSTYDVLCYNFKFPKLVLVVYPFPGK